MSTCRWCTPGGSAATDLLRGYAAGELHIQDVHEANDDLSYCMECVLEYHRARDEVPQLHKALWEMETSRIIAWLEKSLQEEIEEDDELFLIEEDGEKPLFGYTDPNFESKVRVPLLESLKYPYLLLNQRVSQLCADALCKMEQVNNSFQVYEKLPGVYLLLVHPNETVRRWAILTAKAQGKVDRDDYYELQEVFTCLFKVIELGLFENPDLYSTELEEGKLILLPSHLYDTTNYKNYWLGICMLLTVLEEQAMDSLLLGPDKQNDLMQSILHIMEKYTEDESLNPFWPALHCFMMILDRLGSKVWGQLIDPIQAFQTIIASPSYNREIESVRKSCMRPSKTEPDPSDDDDLVTCSQIVYSINTEKKKKDTGWRNAICPDYCPNMYEEMQCLASILQSDIGQDMRVHDSTFLWFVPYVQSVMDLKDLGVAYIIEVIHHLYSEIKDVFNQRTPQCDKVTELFILVLVSIIELHRNKKCLHMLWVSSHKWVEAIVKCALLPAKDQQLRSNPRTATNYSLSSSPNSQTGGSVQSACIQLIRSLLREGYQLGQQGTCKPYLDKLNFIIRGNVCRNLELSKTETQGLQTCLTQIIKSVKDKALSAPSSTLEQSSTSKTQSVPFIKIERMDDDDDMWYGSNCTSPLSSVDTKAGAALSSSFGVEGWSVPTVKSEPQETRISELNPSALGCSSSAKTFKKDLSAGKGCASSADTVLDAAVELNPKPKKELTGWQSKLSKVMEKSSSRKIRRESSVSRRNISDGDLGKGFTMETKAGSIKTEPCDPGLSEVNGNSVPLSGLKRKLKEETSENLPVARQLERLSLENEHPEAKGLLKPHLDEETSGANSYVKIDEEPEDDDDLPLTEIRKRLLKQSARRANLTNSQVDRDLDGLSLAAHAKYLCFSEDSSQDKVAPPEPCLIERKVKGSKRSSVFESSSSDTEMSSDQIITISDSSSDEEIKPVLKHLKPEKLEIRKEDPPSTSSSPSKPTNEVQIKPERSPQTCDQYDSQLFEFETADDVFSVWQDSWVDEKKPSPDQAQKNESSKVEADDKKCNDFESDNDFDQWGYDTDYICDDAIEKAAQDAEKQFRLSMPHQKDLKEKSHSRSNESLSSEKFYGKKSKTSSEKSSKLSVTSKTSTVPKKTPLSSSKTALNKKTETAAGQKISLKSKISRTKSPVRAYTENKKHNSPRKPSLAVVPPKKIRVCPELPSTVEKLGLKKAPRKAFDLSQRSLDSLAELRNYGKSAGKVEPNKQKTKLISPQSLLVKGNKRLLACQDRQFYRQSRPKEKSAEHSESRKRKLETSKHPGKEEEKNVSLSGQNKHTRKSSSDVSPSSSSREEPTYMPSEAVKSSEQSSSTANGESSAGKVACASSPVESTIRSPSTVVKESSNNEEVDDDDGDLFLTQSDPVDMEECSQIQHAIQIGAPEDGSTPNTVHSSPSLPEKVEHSVCKYSGCSETVSGNGEHCAKHSVPEKPSDHLFAKPGLPPSLQKPIKPSTAKVFGSGNISRTAALTKDLENVPKIHGVSKAKVQPPKPAFQRPAMSSTGQNKPSVPQVTNSVLQPLINQNNIPLQTGSSPVFQKGNFPHHQMGLSQMRDPGWLMREVLKWRYEMFNNVSQFGPPRDLCELPLMKVPLRFSGYDEYFNAFFPLMLLNSFESLAQDWSTKQQTINSHLCRLQLQNFCIDSQVNRGEFQAWFRDADFNKQRHPKEDDLVFLLTPESHNSMTGEEGEQPTSLVYHTGYMSRFIRSQRTQIQDKEQYTLCDFCIHTYGNLSGSRNRQVQCVVVGSLITTQRQYKALLNLPKSPLFKPIIHPSPSHFLPRDNLRSEINLFHSLKEYNSDQKNAIEKAYAMVKQHPKLPRICMIHGPPGTGKSKTIVGFLYRILMEKSSSNVPDQNFNVKNKRNRVLVCAPSNAAIDDLMKKIILEFKEKCHDKNNPVGNCGDINLVRLGAEKSISSDVIKFSLDCQVNYRMNRAQQDHNMIKQKEALDRQLDELSRQRAMERCNKNTCEQLEEKIAKLSNERQLLAHRLKEFRRRPQEVQRNIILESHVICCTLSTSGGFLLESAFRQLGQEPFSCVIVDEAGQSCEVENLIPLLHQCSKLVLVGDPEQLPPTVISLKAGDLGFGQSLMSRLCRYLETVTADSPVLQLTVQYRMHPDICLFPSNYFYRRMLKTDRVTEEVRCSSDWPFQPYMVFDVSDGYEKKERESFFNPQEIKVVLALIKLIKSKKKEFCFRNIGIITPYRAQKVMIIDALRKAFGNDNKPGEVDTVDGFQGRQKDCIIVTCVRANAAQGSIGFLASRQRMNVTITRAKFSLFILGNLRTLMENNDWNHLIQDAQKRGALIKTKEDNYQNDVSKILKLKPVAQRTAHIPSGRADERHRDSSHNPPQSKVSRESAKPYGGTAPTPSRPVVPPPDDSRRDSSKNLVSPSTASSAPREKLKDPRLARRLESTKEPQGPSPTSGPSQHRFILNRGQNSSHRPLSIIHFTADVRQPPQPTPGSLNRRPTSSFLSDKDRAGKPASEGDHEAKKRKV
ncbi:probable helicase senataxin isoform X2 [Spea bombifrons]|uniref:probable helicase senataxin isoform X2 n=1 Tax=Spea bombifrons TaxID=233779 RepID=UPI00234B0C05|nr:probable helicase senataxin isoform X2 [Spea bombifrons]